MFVSYIKRNIHVNKMFLRLHRNTRLHLEVEETWMMKSCHVLFGHSPMSGLKGSTTFRELN